LVETVFRLGEFLAEFGEVTELGIVGAIAEVLARGGVFGDGGAGAVPAELAGVACEQIFEFGDLGGEIGDLRRVDWLGWFGGKRRRRWRWGEVDEVHGVDVVHCLDAVGVVGVAVVLGALARRGGCGAWCTLGGGELGQRDGLEGGGELGGGELARCVGGDFAGNETADVTQAAVAGARDALVGVVDTVALEVPVLLGCELGGLIVHGASTGWRSALVLCAPACATLGEESVRILVFGVKTGMKNLRFCGSACLSCARWAIRCGAGLLIHAERLISFEDSRVKRVFEVVLACTTFGRGVRWFNAEETEGEEDAEEGGRRGSRRGPEKGRRRKREAGNMDGQDGQDEGGVVLLEPEAEAPGPVDVDAFVEVIAGTEVCCAWRAQVPSCG